MNENNPKKIISPFFIVLLSILIAAVGLALYVYLVYVPNKMTEIDYNFNNDYKTTFIDFKGDGVEERPYLIETIDDLARLAQIVNNGTRCNGCYFTLTTDLDMTEYLSESGEGYNDGAGWLVIGLFEEGIENYFCGNFDGAGHTISGFWVNRPDITYAGLFGYTLNAEIYNLNVIADSIVSGNNVGGIAGGIEISKIVGCTAIVNNLYGNSTDFYNNLGGIAGSVRMNASIENCSAVLSLNIAVEEKIFIGGIAGFLSENSSITDSISNVKIEAAGKSSTDVGGLVGYSYKNNVIKNCNSTGYINVSGESSASGGLIGCTDNTLISGSNSSCNIIGSWIAGGLVALMNENTTVTDCYASGDVDIRGFSAENADNRFFCGGLAGASGIKAENCIIDRCYATGNVSINITDKIGIKTEANAGGLVGVNDGEIKNSHAIGTVRNEAQNTFTGGLVGWLENGSIAYCYATGDVISKGIDVIEIGGFIGTISSGQITQSYANGNVNAEGKEINAGGFFGKIPIGIRENIGISDCYATGNMQIDSNSDYINSGSFGGDLLRKNKIKNCYSIGFIKEKISVFPTPFEHRDFIKNIVIFDIENCYYETEDIPLEDQTYSYDSDKKPIPKTLEEMQKRETYTGWDFSEIWYMPDGGGYPQLKKFPKFKM